MAEPTLLGMPPEIRNRIYELSLVQDEPIRSHCGVCCVGPALLQTNRQISREARGIYYTANTFQGDWNFAFHLLYTIDRTTLRMLKGVHLLGNHSFGQIEDERRKTDVVKYWPGVFERAGADRAVVLGEYLKFPLVDGDGVFVWCFYDELSQFELVEQEGGVKRWVKKKTQQE
ncbi:hypothetical protein LTR56_022109 [Elasticomyces elasticus]|nr:hypothetical protein LTR56_022109 [Elasticomyces elasticus]KAK3641999.1 hypothetical protein LTR22_016324 [Elasticomyces elasticus]KAK4910650.1 hypothetical protein LTR49_020685 [Elasticomyces elasticus]KAK5748843.1 hypothetical protein LTS12_021081 [Elasticomyces elasticus]